MNIVLYYIVSRVSHWGGGAGTSYIILYTEVPLEYRYHSTNLYAKSLTTGKEEIFLIMYRISYKSRGKKVGYFLNKDIREWMWSSCLGRWTQG